MTYVSIGCKELKTKYKADTPEVGKQMHLQPHGLLGIKSIVPKKDNAGIG